MIRYYVCDEHPMAVQNIQWCSAQELVGINNTDKVRKAIFVCVTYLEYNNTLVNTTYNIFNKLCESQPSIIVIYTEKFKHFIGITHFLIFPIT